MLFNLSLLEYGLLNRVFNCDSFSSLLKNPLATEGA
jgi:hypothetical protein